MSVKLTDAQLVMMSDAGQRKDRCLSAPATIKGAALNKVSGKLAKLGLAREIEAKPGAPIWRRGRLTLNVLLSFAQFEREVTGERIRDKIAGSKKKGGWAAWFPWATGSRTARCISSRIMGSTSRS
jgi:hypothetical protein